MEKIDWEWERIITWESINTAYRNGLAVDMLIADCHGEQGVIWTVAPCSPDALERAGRQFSRSRAHKVLHIRRAVLRRQDRHGQAVVIATELPTRRQQVRDLVTNQEIVLRRVLSDDALKALEMAFAPSAAETV